MSETMEDRIFRYYQEIRKNHIQIITLISGGTALFSAAVLTSNLTAAVRGTLLIFVSVLMVPVCMLHGKARQEMSYMREKLSESESNEWKGMPRMIEYFIQMINISMSGFIFVSVLLFIAGLVIIYVK